MCLDNNANRETVNMSCKKPPRQHTTIIHWTVYLRYWTQALFHLLPYRCFYKRSHLWTTESHYIVLSLIRCMVIALLHTRAYCIRNTTAALCMVPLILLVMCVLMISRLNRKFILRDILIRPLTHGTVSLPFTAVVQLNKKLKKEQVVSI